MRSQPLLGSAFVAMKVGQFATTIARAIGLRGFDWCIKEWPLADSKSQWFTIGIKEWAAGARKTNRTRCACCHGRR